MNRRDDVLRAAIPVADLERDVHGHITREAAERIIDVWTLLPLIDAELALARARAHRDRLDRQDRGRDRNHPQLVHRPPSKEGGGRVTSYPYLATLLDRTVVFVRRFVVIEVVQVDAVALWNAHSYVYEYAAATPYLHPHSPEQGSGKNDAARDVLALTARDALQADNLTEAVLFRLVGKQRPTLLFDEVDAVFGKKNTREGIRQVLNSGYRKGKQAFRCVHPAMRLSGSTSTARRGPPACTSCRRHSRTGRSRSP
jgi:hypothetical protein